MKRVKIVFVGSKNPNEVSRSGAPIGRLATNKTLGTILGDSLVYNSSFLVKMDSGEIYDIHDQHFEYLPG
jgi:hypothetical protein